MSRVKFATAALAAVVLATGPSLSFAVPPLPTDDSIQQLLDVKRYAEAESQLNRLLLCKPDVVRDNDRSRDYLMLSECQLQQKKETLLRKTILAAAEYAEDQHDLTALSDVAVLALPLIASRQFVYSPAKDRKAKYDLLDPAQRAQASKLAYAESLLAVGEGWRSARSKRDLAPVVELSAKFALVRGAEKALTGQTGDTEKLESDIEEGAAAMINRRLSADLKQLDVYRVNALTKVDRKMLGPRGFYTIKVNQGLNARQLADLKDIHAFAVELPKQIDLMNRALAQPLKLDDNGPSADEVRTKAEDVADVLK